MPRLNYSFKTSERLHKDQWKLSCYQICCKATLVLYIVSPYKKTHMCLLAIQRIYIRAHILLNILNELGKEIKCEACRAFYRVFATRLIYKSNNTGARMLDSYYHMALRLLLSRVFGVNVKN